MQFIRSLFPGGEIHVEDGNSEGTATGSEPDQARTSGGAESGSEAEPRASEEGIYFSNLLRQMMPLISQQSGSESDVAPPEQANASEVGVFSVLPYLRLLCLFHLKKDPDTLVLC